MTNDGSYIFPKESMEETLRLALQSDLLAPITDVLFPDGFGLTPFREVLDIACGTGDWSLALAREHPEVEVVGIDIDEPRLQIVRREVFNAGMNDQPLPANARFLHMDALQRLDFPNGRFDLVNGRFLSSFATRQAWPGVLHECHRILRPGGVIRLTETELPHTNSAAFEWYMTKLAEALSVATLSFSSSGRDMSVTPLLSPLLSEANFQPLQERASFLNFSFGQRGYHYSYQNVVSAFKLVQQFLVDMNVTTLDMADSWYNQVLIEMRESTFRGGSFFLTVWAQKPMR